jgi:hypothetical protein
LPFRRHEFVGRNILAHPLDLLSFEGLAILLIDGFEAVALRLVRHVLGETLRVSIVGRVHSAFRLKVIGDPAAGENQHG